MNKLWLQLLLAGSVALGATQAHAQMYKCVGPKGEITFTKHGCNTVSQTQKIEVGAVNSQDSSADRRNIDEYQQRRSMQPKGTRVTVIADSRIAERQQKERKDLCHEASTPYKGAQNRQLTIRQRAMARACDSGASADEIQRISLEHKQAATRVAPSVPSVSNHELPAPSHITNCDQGGCWDNMGNRYNQGAGPTHFRQDGRVCQQVGSMMQCN